MNNIPSFNEYLNLAKNKTLLNQTPKNTLSQQSVSIPKEIDSFELNEKFEQAKKQNGLIEKIADKIKSATNIGFSSKKIEQSINETKKAQKQSKKLKKK